jgi:hypothetical protein
MGIRFGQLLVLNKICNYAFKMRTNLKMNNFLRYFLHSETFINYRQRLNNFFSDIFTKGTQVVIDLEIFLSIHLFIQFVDSEKL